MTARAAAATYRLQLNSAFTLQDAARLVPFLHALGITDAYVSPVLEAQPGSTHGYDVTDFAAVRTAIGGESALELFAHRLRQSDMGLLLDIVPNHMAATPGNPWWTDLLEYGADSPFAGWFDLSWSSSDEQTTVDLPILGADLTELLEKGQILLAADDAGLALRYSEHRFPLSPATYPAALAVDGHSGRGRRYSEELPEQAREALRALEELPAPTLIAEPGDPTRRERARLARDRFLRLCREAPEFREWVEARIRASAEQPREQQRKRLEALLGLQPYRLRSWRTATHEISYRRFFDITHLVGVRVEQPDVFEATHALFRDWIHAGLVTGLRIDHIDGLYDPEAYLRRLRGLGHVYTIVEKILTAEEVLRHSWQAEGTTGYDFLNTLNGWFIEPGGLRRLRETWARVTRSDAAFDDIAYASKQLVLERLFGGEIAALVRELQDFHGTAHAEGVDDAALVSAMRAVTACLDVYRTYVSDRGIDLEDRLRIESALTTARLRSQNTPPAAFDLLRRVLLLEDLDESPASRTEVLRFVMHWQQLTGPVMAKGFEDTALYNYHPLVSANEVGADAGDPVVGTDQLHEFLAERTRSFPATMNATSTHDSKRSEDVRARINVLSEIPERWDALVDVAAQHQRSEVDANDELLLLQTLVATWPLHGEPDAEYAERVHDYMRKAAREAKAQTTWSDPDTTYEESLATRVHTLLESPVCALLRERIEDLASTLAHAGALNALAQVIIKCTAPGVPDFYQGCELPFLALVDPDNRRPVDFERHAELLSQLEPLIDAPDPAGVGKLLANWADGRIKLFVTTVTLRHRRAHPEIFAAGAYLRIPVTGSEGARVIAFGRSAEDCCSLTVASRWLTRMMPRGTTLPPPEAWQDTALALPPELPRAWRNVISGERVQAADDGSLSVALIFRTLPSAILYPAA
jgi:(1->4)-alpha-D-glucan 1-alpha-D-glucosylmutase